MSFGLGKTVDAVSTAVKQAFDRNKIIFAAAANNGGLWPRSYPATLPEVICVHATDGNGVPAVFNPYPATGIDNFATIGVAIDSKWDGKDVTKSGTSFATPVAAGIAANVLHFARTYLTAESDKKWLGWLHSYRGMRDMLSWMSHKDSRGFQNLRPWAIFPPQIGGVQQSHINDVCENIRTAMARGQIPQAWESETWLYQN